jgi:hypothetical protein
LKICAPERAHSYMNLQELLADVGSVYLIRVQLLSGAALCIIAVMTALSLAQTTDALGDSRTLSISVVVFCVIFFFEVLFYIVQLVSSAGLLNFQIEENTATMLDIEHQLLRSIECQKLIKGKSKYESAQLNQIIQSQVLSSVAALEDTREMMVERFNTNPVTFLGFKAGPAMFTSIGTLAATSVSSMLSQLIKKNN